MSAQHTPGPWEHAEAGSWRNGKRISTEYFVRRPEDNVSIAADIIDPETSEPSEANAQLIAAAPELLEALKKLTAAFERTGLKLYSLSGQPTATDLAIAAIAKAEGRME